MNLEDIFEGPVKRAIVRHLVGKPLIRAGDLCRLVYPDPAKRNRDTLRVLISQMKPKLEQNGWTIDGRRELGQNAYRLRPLVM